MRRLSSLLATIALGLSLSAQGLSPLSPEAAARAIREINAANAGVRSISAEFLQVKEISILKDRMVSSGKMYFQDGKLRWEYLKPNASIFVTGNDRTGTGRMFTSIAGMMTGTLTGLVLDESSGFKVVLYSPGEGYVADLEPQMREMKRMFSKIRLTFGADDRVRQVELFESQGKTTISLSNVRYDAELDPELFVAGGQ